MASNRIALFAAIFLVGFSITFGALELRERQAVPVVGIVLR